MIREVSLPEVYMFSRRNQEGIAKTTEGIDSIRIFALIERMHSSPTALEQYCAGVYGRFGDERRDEVDEFFRSCLPYVLEDKNRILWVRKLEQQGIEYIALRESSEQRLDPQAFIYGANVAKKYLRDTGLVTGLKTARTVIGKVDFFMDQRIATPTSDVKGARKRRAYLVSELHETSRKRS